MLRKVLSYSSRIRLLHVQHILVNATFSFIHKQGKISSFSLLTFEQIDDPNNYSVVSTWSIFQWDKRLMTSCKKGVRKGASLAILRLAAS